MKRYNHSPFTVTSWFGKSENQIKVQKVRGEAKYRLTYMGETHVLSTYDYETMREEAPNYKDKEAWFKNTYWRTEPGKARQIEIANSNLTDALRQYNQVPSDLRRYALELWTSLSDSNKDRLWETENKILAQTFRYTGGKQAREYGDTTDERRREIDSKSETPSMTADDDIEVINSFIQKMENYFTPEQRAAIRERANAKQLKYQ